MFPNVLTEGVFGSVPLYENGKRSERWVVQIRCSWTRLVASYSSSSVWHLVIHLSSYNEASVDAVAMAASGHRERAC